MEKKVIVEVWNIDWDIDDNDISNCFSNDGRCLSDWNKDGVKTKFEVWDDEDDEVIEDSIVDKLSDISGWCVNRFYYALIDK